MSHDLSLSEIKKEYHGTYKAYAIGFITSLILTGASFLLVIEKVFPAQILTYVIVGLAFIQAIVQLLFFLHVGQEAKPQWETLVFYFMVLVIVIVVIGTLWIMYDLNNRTMLNMQMEIPHD